MTEKELKFWRYSLKICRILALLRNILSEDEVLVVEELYLDLLNEVGQDIKEEDQLRMYDKAMEEIENERVIYRIFIDEEKNKIEDYRVITGSIMD